MSERYWPEPAEYEAVVAECNRLREALELVGYPSAIGQLVAERDRLREALVWYEEQVRCCRMLSPQGDTARNSLDADGGKRARVALAKEV